MSHYSDKQMVEVRRLFNRELGPENLKRLHKQNRFLDSSALVMMALAFLLLMAALALLPIGFLWLLCFVLQGFLLMNFGLAYHDLFMHRRAFRGKLGYIISLCLMVPIYRSPTQFNIWHAVHHTHLAKPEDSEQFKTDIDTTWRRFLYATAIGALMHHRVFPQRQNAKVRVIPSIAGSVEKLRSENRNIRWFTIGWFLLACIWPAPVLFGYVLPLLIVAPFVSTVRTVIEHSEFDLSNPFQFGCYYRTNLLTRYLFFWGSGDCHFVHHVYPKIPFYRISQAVRLMRPYFIEHRVIEHRSLIALVWKWFVKERPYFSPPG